MNKILFFLSCLIILFSCSTQTEGTDLETNDEILFSDIVLNENGQIVTNGTVILYASNERFTTTTDENGRYSLSINSNLLPTEGFIAMSLIVPDYEPLNLVYNAPLNNESVYDSGYKSHSLRNCPNCLIILNENSSELIHLGDDSYNGTENSQLQKETDGVLIEFDFVNSSDYSKLRIHFEAKGIQSSLFDVGNSISFGDNDLEVFLIDSPIEGSYETYSIEIDNNLLFDKISFRATNIGNPELGFDDWEFNALSIEGVQ